MRPLKLIPLILLLLPLPLIRQIPVASAEVPFTYFYFHYSERGVVYTNKSSGESITWRLIANTTPPVGPARKETFPLNESYEYQGQKFYGGGTGWSVYPVLGGYLRISGEINITFWVNVTHEDFYTVIAALLCFDDEGYVAWNVTMWTQTPQLLGTTPARMSFSTIADKVYEAHEGYVLAVGIALATLTEPPRNANASVIYDSPEYPSLLKVHATDYVMISVSFCDVNGTERDSFSVLWREDQRRITVRANVTDSLGSYDIDGTSAALRCPNGTSRNYSPAILSRSNYSVLFVFQINYCKTDILGRYECSFSASSSSGVTGSGSSSFLLYEKFLSLEVQIVDDLEIPVESVDVLLEHLQYGLSEKASTASDGRCELILPAAGEYAVSCYYRSFKVLSSTISIQENTSVVFKVALYYLTVRVEEERGNPVGGAYVLLKSGNFSESSTTNSTGIAILSRIPKGTYELCVKHRDLWKNSSITVESSKEVVVVFPGVKPAQAYPTTLIIVLAVGAACALALFLYFRYKRHRPAGT